MGNFRQAPLVHRDYELEGAKTSVEIDDDKIVIKSPGLPVEPISFDDVKLFKAPSLSRNPKITYVYNQMDFMEESELGMETFRSMLDKYNLPLPEYSYQAPFLVLTFRRSIMAVRNAAGNENLSSLTDEELNGLEWIRSVGDTSTKEYSQNFGYSQRTASRHLRKMLNLGLLITNVENLKSPLLRYSLNI